MSKRSGRRRASGFLAALLFSVIATGCKSSQLQTARVISEDRNTVVIAIPENTTRLRERAERLAQSKLGKDIAFVKGGEVTTEDVEESRTKAGRRFTGNEVEQTKAVRRREYQVTFRSKRSTGG